MKKQQWAFLFGLFFLTGLLCNCCVATDYAVVEWLGSACSGKVLDLKGEWFNEGKRTELLIRSERNEGRWDCPRKIVIRNLKIRGSIRVMGMGRNGESEVLRRSSVRLGHTQRARNAAPAEIMISNITFEGDGRIPLYLAPGVTKVTVENCIFNGRSASVCIYLDAEGGEHVIRNNIFNVATRREVIAVDGSANNRIENNRFVSVEHGGIYVYRNCGEGGTVRHQKPEHNVIAYNDFNLQKLQQNAFAVWLGARGGRRYYCEQDRGYPFGSSIDNGDFADFNEVFKNHFSGNEKRAVRDDGRYNRIE